MSPKNFFAKAGPIVCIQPLVPHELAMPRLLGSRGAPQKIH
jgi:hypothetical protein